MVGGMCSMLPYGTGICCYAFKFFFFYCFCPFLLYTFKKPGIAKSTEWSTITVCPSLMCFFFFNRGNTEGTNSSKILCLMFCVYFVICKVVSGLILLFLGNLWFDDLCEE